MQSRFQIEKLEERVVPTFIGAIGNVIVVQGSANIGDHNINANVFVNAAPSSHHQGPPQPM